MSKLTDYIETYPFPSIDLENLTKGINKEYNTNYSQSEIENIICNFFIINFTDKDSIKDTKTELDFYNWVNLNEPVCNSTGDCKGCNNYKLCIQAPEVYQPNTDFENEAGTLWIQKTWSYQSWSYHL